jgi:hypothetical protein
MVICRERKHHRIAYAIMFVSSSHSLCVWIQHRIFPWQTVLKQMCKYITAMPGVVYPLNKANNPKMLTPAGPEMNLKNGDDDV